MARIDEQDLDEKRLARRQRRKRSQLIAYIILFSLCLLIFVGAGVLIHFLGGAVRSRKAAQQEETLEEAQETREEGGVIETPEESPQAQEYSEEDILSEIIEGVIAEESLEDKVAGLFIITPEQLTGVETAVKAGSGTQEALASYAVGGITYSPKNIKTTDQIKEMLDTTSSMSKYPIFTVMSSQAGTADAVREVMGFGVDESFTDEEGAYTAGSSMGSELFKNGFNFAVAPSMDPSSDTDEEIDPDEARKMALGFARGLVESGITACPYVFPLEADTLTGKVSNEISRDDLVVGQYEAYKQLIDEGVCGAIMVSNISLPTVTGDDVPASLSDKIITEDLRGALVFEGVVITSPLNEGAVTESFSSAEAAVTAIKAGADMLYVPDDFEAAYQGILDAVSSGHLTEDRIDESLRRIYSIKYAGRADQISKSN